MNFFLLVLAVSPLFVREWKALRFRYYHFLPWGWFILQAINLSGTEYKTYLTLRESLFLSLWLFLLPLRDTLIRSVPWFSRNALAIAVVICSIYFFVPLLFFPASSLFSQRSILFFLGGSPNIDLLCPSLASVLVIFCNLGIRDPLKARRGIHLAGFFVGVAMLVLTTSRTGLLSALLVSLALSARAIHRDDWRKHKDLLGLSFTLLIVHLSPNVLAKYGYGGSFVDQVRVRYESYKESETNPTIQMSVDDLLNTNGRRFLYDALLNDMSLRHIFTGRGTGSSLKFLAETKNPMGEPHSEYIRIFYEQGIIGVLAFFGLILFVLFTIQPNAMRFALLGPAIWMIGNNYLFEPIYGYGYFLLLLFLWRPSHTPSPALVQVEKF